MLEKMGKTLTVMTADESERLGNFVLAVALGPASGLSGSFHGRLILAGLVPVMLGTPIPHTHAQTHTSMILMFL